MGIREQVKDPLLGFGWAGYVCAAIFIALLTPVIAGIDLQYEFLKLIVKTLGVDAMMYVVPRLYYVVFSIVGASVSVTTGAAVLVAFKIAPYRVSRYMQLGVFLLSSMWFAMLFLSLYISKLFETGINLFVSSFYSLVAVEVSGIVLVGVLVSYQSRSRFVAAMWALAVVLALMNMFWFTKFNITLPGDIALLYPFDDFPYSTLTLVFDLLTMGSLILWAILERRKVLPAQCCLSCGYDLAGLSGNITCPECGEKTECNADEESHQDSLRTNNP